jgi:molybdopterin/thiamine biosynthesis adenylyltransferase
MNSEFSYDEAFARNLGILTADEQTRLRTARIGIAGLGGAGGNYMLALARLGIGALVIADSDRFEVVNFNRQAGAMMTTLGRAKTDVMEEMAKDINPEIEIRKIASGLNTESTDEFFDGVDLVIDAIDSFAVDSHNILHSGAQERGLYSICGGAPFGFGASITTFGPTTPSFVECFGWADGDDEVAKLRKVFLGLAPAGLPRAYLPERLTDIRPPKESIRLSGVSPALYFCTALAATEAVCILLDRRQPLLAPNVLQIDLVTRALAVSNMMAKRA